MALAVIGAGFGRTGRRSSPLATNGLPDAPFPRGNSRDETRAILERMMAGEGNSAGDPMPDLATTFRGRTDPSAG